MGQETKEKRISEFVMSTDLGFALSLEDAELATMVNPEDGTVVFFEGEGEGRATGVCLPGELVVALEVVPRPNPGAKVNVIYKTERDADSQERYSLGITPDEDSARAWVNRVNTALEQRKTA
jgi:hypothetical protein